MAPSGAIRNQTIHALEIFKRRYRIMAAIELMYAYVGRSAANQHLQVSIDKGNTLFAMMQICYRPKAVILDLAFWQCFLYDIFFSTLKANEFLLEFVTYLVESRVNLNRRALQCIRRWHYDRRNNEMYHTSITSTVRDSEEAHLNHFQESDSVFL